jgi:hypothetical protein
LTLFYPFVVILHFKIIFSLYLSSFFLCL